MAPLRRGQEGITLIELLIVLAILGIVVGITALAVSRFMDVAAQRADDAELGIVQRAMWAHQVSDEMHVVPTAECVVDLGASDPALYPRFLRDEHPRPGNAYSWDAKGNVFRCGEPPPLGIEESSGAYFANEGLSGQPVLTRDEPTIAFDWGTGSPGEGLPKNRFSVRWRHTVSTHEPAILRINARADDGVRVYLDGDMVMDAWTKKQAKNARAVVPIDAGNHSLVTEYHEKNGRAHAFVEWSVQPASSSALGSYYKGRKLKGKPIIERQDAAIDFQWGLGSPDPALPKNSFSVRWEMPMEVEESGTYRFTATVDDGVRLSVDGTRIINRWSNQSGKPRSADIALASGAHLVEMEYYEGRGQALAQLGWQRVH